MNTCFRDLSDPAVVAAFKYTSEPSPRLHKYSDATCSGIANAFDVTVGGCTDKEKVVTMDIGPRSLNDSTAIIVAEFVNGVPAPANSVGNASHCVGEPRYKYFEPDAATGKGYCYKNRTPPPGNADYIEHGEAARGAEVAPSRAHDGARHGFTTRAKCCLRAAFQLLSRIYIDEMRATTTTKKN